MAVINPNANSAGSGLGGRIHVNRAAHWTRTSGTDFWYREQEAGTAADDLITNYGWTTTALSYSITGGGDLLASADTGSPAITIGETANDLLLSPSIFGDYSASLVAANILGYTPTTLNLECYAAFTIATGAETTSGFGFSTGSSLTVTNHIAFIHSDGTNFAIRGTPGTGGFIDTGALVSTTYHLWKIVATAGGTVEWFMDGTSNGTITLVTDLYPTAFSMSVATNDIGLAWAHVWYA
jgi:hypothetical protein